MNKITPHFIVIDRVGKATRTIKEKAMDKETWTNEHFLSEWNRMCQACLDTTEDDRPDCSKCPISKLDGAVDSYIHLNLACRTVVFNNPVAATHAVQEWAKSNPPEPQPHIVRFTYQSYVDALRYPARTLPYNMPNEYWLDKIYSISFSSYNIAEEDIRNQLRAAGYFGDWYNRCLPYCSDVENITIVNISEQMFTCRCQIALDVDKLERMVKICECPILGREHFVHTSYLDVDECMKNGVISHVRKYLNDIYEVINEGLDISLNDYIQNFPENIFKLTAVDKERIGEWIRLYLTDMSVGYTVNPINKRPYIAVKIPYEINVAARMLQLSEG